jgi:hypothetical protein
MTADEWDRWLREQVARYGRDLVVAFVQLLASRRVAGTPARQRGYTDARFTPHAPDCQTRRR